MTGATNRQRAIGGRQVASASDRGLSLLAAIVGGAALGATLWRIDGPPRLLAGAPDWARLREVLAGSELADADVIAAAATVAWLALGYLALAIGLRFLVVLAVRLTDGASWARAALRLSNLVTIPAVRRVVDGGVAGTLMLASWLPAPSRIAIAAEPVAVVAIAPPLTPTDHAAGPAPEYQTVLQRQGPGFVEYTVVRGDYLWDIARRCYGDGSRFVEIFEANRDRVMTAGERFTDPRLLRPGWVLRIPLPAQNLDVTGPAITYRVREGDHLWGIAERFLGDGFRWVEIWERNRGRELSAGRRLTDPDLIFPGWLLELPIAIPAAAPPAPAPFPALPAAPSSATAVPAVTASPTTTATAPNARDEEQAAIDETEHGGGWSWEWPSVPRRVLVTAAGFAVIGGTAVFVQRLIRSGRLRLSSSSTSREGPGDAGRVTLATRALSRALGDYGFAESQPVLVRESGRRLEFTVRCPVGDGEALVSHRHDLGRRLACEINAEVIGATRVMLTLSGFQRLAGLLGEEAAGATPALVVPVGADEGGIVYVNLAAAGSVAIAGSESERRQLLRSWLATLATTHAPQQLALRVDAAVAELLGEYVAIPHTGGATPADSARMAAELAELVQSRSARSGDRAVLAVTAAPADGHEFSLDGVLRDGPRSGVFVIATLTAETAAVRDGAFGASVVFAGSAANEAVDDASQGLGAIALTVGRDRPISLDPVIVRRDPSTRWSASAEGRTADPFAWSRDHIEASDAELPEAILAEASGPSTPDELPSHAGTDDVEPDVSDVLQVDAESGGHGGEADIDQEGPAASEPVPVAAENDVVAEATVALLTAPTAEPASPALGPPVATRQAALFTVPRPDTEGEATAAIFKVRCLERFEIQARGALIKHWSLEKARELLAFLVAQGGASVAREVVAEALWPDYAWDASSKHMLANTASTLRNILRSAMGDDDRQPLIAARQRFQLPSALFEVDLDAIEASFRCAASLPDAEALSEYERALSLYTGDFLEGELFTWLDSHRMDYRQRLIDAARRAAQIAIRLDAPARATTFYQAILEREPTDEIAARGLMRCFAASGDVNGARKTFKALSEALQRELDDPRAGPSAETRALLSELIAATQNG